MSTLVGGIVFIAFAVPILFALWLASTDEKHGVQETSTFDCDYCNAYRANTRCDNPTQLCDTHMSQHQIWGRML